jgi:Uma2 family endonuclease
MSQRGEQVAIELTPRRFTAAEYHQMIEAGVFGQDERLELIDGEIVQMSPIGDRHAACVRRLNELLGQLFAGRVLVDVQNPVVVESLIHPSQTWRCCVRGPITMRLRRRPRPTACW